MRLGDDDIAVTVEAARRTSAGLAVVGTVAASGTRAAALLGRRVLVGPVDPCGECEICRRGGASVCPAARQRPVDARIDDGIVAAARWATMLGDGLELPLPGAAVVAGDAAIAYTLYARTGLQPRDPAVVVGASPIARFLVEILLAKSITPTVLVEPSTSDAWVAWLTARGVDIARDRDDDPRAAVTSAIAARGLGARPWRILATDPALASRAAALAGPRATLTVLGDRGTALDAAALVADEVTLVGVRGAHPDLLVEVAALCVRGDLDLVGGTTTRPDDPDPTRAVVETLVHG